jgi:lambda family phage portal protein
MARANHGSITRAFNAIRADYEAAHDSRLRRKRTGYLTTGSNADYHLRNGSDHLKILEQARDMDRNDVLIGQMVDRVVLNIVQGGFAVDPKTGDDGLDKELWGRFDAWANDPKACDAQGERPFSRLEELVCRQRIVDGEIFALPLEDGPLQLMESHRCRSPQYTKDNVVLGIRMDPDTRERQEYWFTQEDIDPLAPSPKAFDAFDRRPAFDEQGEPLVFHCYDPRRDTQTRGISAFAPIMITATMIEDVMIAKLVQQQVVSCITFIRNRLENFEGDTPEAVGPEESFMFGAFEAMVQQMSPGLELSGQPGEKIEPWSPNVPNETFFPHIRMMIQMLGINLGMPLVMVLMDATETNFSGWRGAVDQAQRGFRRSQFLQASQFNSRVYRWRMRWELARDESLKKWLTNPKIKFFAHGWNTPKWPYIQPLQDAQADALRQRERLTSPRRLHAERGQDWDDIYAEIIADNTAAITAAIRASQQIEKDTGVKVHWREALYITTPTPANVVIDEGDGDSGQGGKRTAVEARR